MIWHPWRKPAPPGRTRTHDDAAVKAIERAHESKTEATVQLIEMRSMTRDLRRELQVNHLAADVLKSMGEKR